MAAKRILAPGEKTSLYNGLFVRQYDTYWRVIDEHGHQYAQGDAGFYEYELEPEVDYAAAAAAAREAEQEIDRMYAVRAALERTPVRTIRNGFIHDSESGEYTEAPTRQRWWRAP